MKYRVNIDNVFWYFDLDQNTSRSSNEIYLKEISRDCFALRPGSIIEIRTDRGTSYGFVKQIVLSNRVFKDRKAPYPLDVRINWIYSQQQLKEIGYQGKALNSISWAFTDHEQNISVNCLNGVVQNLIPNATVSLSK